MQIKKIITLIIGILIAIPAICQVDSLSVIVTKDRTAIKLLPIKLRKVIRQELNMGMDAVFLPETDVQNGNVPKTKSHILVYQIPMSVVTTQAQLDSITNYIKKITEPVIIPKPDIVVYIDDQATTGNVYSTGWTSLKSQSWQKNHVGNSSSFTANTGTSNVKITIDGYKFEWITEKRVNHGIATVQIDTQPAIEVDLYATNTDNPSMIVYTSPELSNGQHIITISMTGRKNPAATEANIIHDAIKVYKKQ